MCSLSCGPRLFNNQIGDQGATAIGDALKVNGALTKLSLGSNRIGGQGATAIADALKFNGALKLKELVVDDLLLGHTALKAACAAKGVRLW
jgi:hypothetical protein